MGNTIKHLKDLFRRSPRAADTADVPQPLSPQTGDIPAQGAQRVERHVKHEFINGMNIELYQQDEAFIINNELVTYERESKRVAGCGCVVSRIGEAEDKEDNIKDKTGTQQSSKETAFELVKEQEIPKKVLSGICRFCRAEALQLVRRGELLPDQVDLYSSYCNFCQRTCSSCNRNTCKRHNLSFENPDGSISMLCPECQVTGSRQKLTHKFFGGIASFFLEHETPPPEKKPSPDNKYPDSFMFLAIFLVIACITLVFASAEPPVTSAICPSFSTSPSFSFSDNVNQVNTWSIQMNNQRDDPSDSRFLFNKRKGRFRSLQPDEYETLLRLEAELRTRQLYHREDIRRWYRIVAYGGKYNRTYAIEKLQLAVEADRIETMRYPDDAAFRPLGPEVLLRQGSLHLLNQVVDGVPFMVPRDSPLRGVFVAGPVGSGKTRFMVYICEQLCAGNVPVRLLVIDPKGGLAAFWRRLRAIVIDISDISLDLSPPENIGGYAVWLPEILPFISSQCSLIQSIELILEAGSIALGLKEKLDQKIADHSDHSKLSELCLKDIQTCLTGVRDTDRGRRLGYMEAASTALSRVINATGNLFSCRRGVPISELFNHNIIITCSSLTDELACKVFVTYLLYWKFAESRDKKETNELRNLVVIDDSQRFLSAKTGDYSASFPTTPLSHVVSVLRSSGCGLMVATQLPGHVDPGVIALSNLIVAIGGIHDVTGQQALGNIMSLTAEQRKALVRLGCREAVGFYGAGAYRRPVRGTVPYVSDPEGA